MRKVIHMVGVLGSDNDGEVLAAARGIQRVLRSVNLSFGDLKSELERLFDPPETRYVPVPVDTVRERVVRLAEELAEYADFMHDHEARFVRDMLTKITANDGFKMTPKQSNWFAALYAKYAT